MQLLESILTHGLLSILNITLGKGRHRLNGHSERAPNGVKRRYSLSLSLESLKEAVYFDIIP